MQRFYGAWELRLKGVYEPDLVLPITSNTSKCALLDA